MIRRTISSALVAALLAGCDAPIAPRALEGYVDVAGTYYLQAWNGAPLPVMIATNHQVCDASGCVPTGLSTWLIAGSVTLAPDGTVTRVSTYRTSTVPGSGGEVTSATQSGTYRSITSGRAMVVKLGTAPSTLVMPVTTDGTLHLPMAPSEVFRYQR